MAATAFVRARMDEQVRKEAAAVLADMGLTVSDAIRITLTAIAREGALPFELRAPNAVTREAMREARTKMRSGDQRFEAAGELIDAIEQEIGQQQASESAATVRSRQAVSQGLGKALSNGTVRHDSAKAAHAVAGRKRRPVAGRMAGSRAQG